MKENIEKILTNQLGEVTLKKFQPLSKMHNGFVEKYLPQE